MTESNITGSITKDKLLELIKEEKIDTVVLGFCDMQGRLMGKRITGDFILENDISEGTHFCNYLLGTNFEMDTNDGYEYMNWDKGYGDYLAKPDLDTLKVVPWLERTALVFCDVYTVDGEEKIEIAPRNILKKQIEKAEAHGLSPHMASELEFYLFNDSFSNINKKGYSQLEPAGHLNEDYNLLQGSKNEPIYQEIRHQMHLMGIVIESSKGEAYKGQHEINLKYSNALKAADQHLMFKHGMKEICIQNDKSVTFMAKPYEAWTGSSGHIHLSMMEKGTHNNAFYNGEDAENPMSETMRHFLAGIIKYTRDFALMFAPYVNSYKRFAPNSWAPVSIAWSKDNRSAGYRMVGCGNALRFESRIAGADMNPYLAYSALIGAGLYGIEHKIPLSEELKGNAYNQDDVERIPSSLHEAILTWKNSDVVKSVLGEDVAQHYLHAAQTEQNDFDSYVTTWERSRYFEQS
ncbi:glutamine synthetase [Staphylococcus succinus]|jgi:glutamine synthetase|uniref:Glutamine synthetase n=1 Tax=Staphylococcus succinus TaxID=61015 RepID=A0ABX5IRW5_9STAP|nr:MULTISPECIES: glutamine synthetase family protein [Staphylococcus]MBU0438668.1 glutamine synthetase family protein [Staphylococcus succinus]MDH9160587.1 glutamine synthetase family protein [Staphylococcus succinus]MEB8123763.1 glutamine synthetase family protein [Staphylococcus succinus]MEB8127544.1 glutamine synthetase family protein [Staphylococcus succinus]MEB8210374.1 glutamine synthetase family protein [Staphylococcus succinus]